MNKESDPLLIKRLKIWTATIWAFFVTALITFSPLIIPKGVSEPFILGLPRTIWAGLMVSVIFLIITAIAAWASKPEQKETEK